MKQIKLRSSGVDELDVKSSANIVTQDLVKCQCFPLLCNPQVLFHTVNGNTFTHIYALVYVFWSQFTSTKISQTGSESGARPSPSAFMQSIPFKERVSFISVFFLLFVLIFLLHFII